MVQSKAQRKTITKTTSVQAVSKLKKQLLVSQNSAKKAKKEVDILKSRLRKLESQQKQKQTAFKRLLQETEIKASKKASEYAIKTFEKQNANRVKAVQRALMQTEKSWERECAKRLSAQIKPTKSKSSATTRARATRSTASSRNKNTAAQRVSALIGEC